MPNEWNNLFDEVFNAGAKIFGNIREEGRKDDAYSVYQTAMDNIKKSLSNTEQTSLETPTQEQSVNPINEVMKNFDAGGNNPFMNMQPADITGSPLPGEIIKPRVTAGNNPPEIPIPNTFDSYMNGLTELVNSGKYGAPYIPLLEAGYEGMKPKAPKTKTDVTNGYLIKYDEEGNILKKTKIDDLPKQEKNNVLKYSKMTLEEAELLQDNELTGDAFFYLPQDVQTALMQKYPALQQLHDKKFEEGDFSPKGPGFKKGKGFGKLNIPISDKGSDDNKKFDALAEYNNKINAGADLSLEDEDKYNTLRLDLGNRYNMDDTQLAKVIDRLEGSTSENDRKKIINEIEKGEYHEDVGTSQEQMDYDRGRILEWQTALDQSYSANDGSYDGYKQSFLKELQDFYFRGSLTAKEYADLKKMYF